MPDRAPNSRCLPEAKPSKNPSKATRCFGYRIENYTVRENKRGHKKAFVLTLIVVLMTA
jgi:hypothetical protein